MSQIQKKFLANDAVDGQKFKLLNNTFLRARNAANDGDVNIIKLNASDVKEFASGNLLIQGSLLFTGVSADIGDSSDIVQNIYVDKLFGGENCGARSIDVTQGQMFDASAVIAMDWTQRTLHDGAGDKAIDLSAYGQLFNRVGGTSDDSVLAWGDNTVDEHAISIRTQDVAGTPGPRNLQFWSGENNNTRYVAMRAPATLAGAVDFVLPATEGTNGQVLSTDGNGVTSWEDPAAGGSDVFAKETHTLDGTDITNQYIDLAVEAKANSIHFIVKGGAPTVEGASHDYSVDYTGGAGGVTRITFLNDLATGGSAALIATDVVQVAYVEA